LTWYYVWLKVLTGWPETLLSWDVLFLIPLRWWGPVLSPVLIAALICASAVLVVTRMERGQRLEITPVNVGSLTAGGLLALYVFMSDSLHALLHGWTDWDTLRPGPFQVALVSGGAGLDGPAQPEGHLVGALQPWRLRPFSLARSK
jgi:hypothetical protein